MKQGGYTGIIIGCLKSLKKVPKCTEKPVYTFRLNLADFKTQ